MSASFMMALALPLVGSGERRAAAADGTCVKRGVSTRGAGRSPARFFGAFLSKKSKEMHPMDCWGLNPCSLS